MDTLPEIERLLHNLIRIGRVHAADHANALVRVKCGDNLTDWLPQPAAIGHNFIAWTPMRIGQTVTLACPSGDLAQARIVSSGYTADIPSPSGNRLKDIIQFNDGTRIEYDSAAQMLSIHSAKNIHISAANHLTLSASHTFINSAVTQTNGDMTSDGISAQNHTHAQNDGSHHGGGVNTDKPS